MIDVGGKLGEPFLRLKFICRVHALGPVVKFCVFLGMSEESKTVNSAIIKESAFCRQFEKQLTEIVAKWPDMTWKHRRLLGKLHPHQEGKCSGWNPITEKEWHKLQSAIADYTSCKLTATFILDLFSSHDPDRLPSSAITVFLQFGGQDQLPSEYNWQIMMCRLREATSSITHGTTCYFSFYHRDQLQPEERPNDWSHTFVVIVYSGQLMLLHSMAHHHRLRVSVLPSKRDKKTKKLKWDFFTKLKQLIFSDAWNDKTTTVLYTDLFGRKFNPNNTTRKSRIHFHWQAQTWKQEDVEKNYSRLLALDES